MELLEIENIVKQLRARALYGVSRLKLCQNEDCIHKQQYFDPPTDKRERNAELVSRINRVCEVGKCECLWGVFLYSERVIFPKEIEKRLEKLTSWLLELNGNEPTKAEQYLIDGIGEALADIQKIIEHPLMTKGNNRAKIKRLAELYNETAERLNWYTAKAIPTPQQITDEAKETVKPYFTAEFKGIGRENDTNYFEILIADLIRRKTAKEKATILLLAFESKEVNTKRPNSFAEWLRIWGNVLGCKLDYKQNKLDISTVQGQCWYLHLKGGQIPKIIPKKSP